MKRTILLSGILSLLSICPLAYAGHEGGGGDATELRVNEIRSDILSWISKDRARELVLPNELPYDEYVSKMTKILQPKKVVVGFVEQDDLQNDELKVSVNGMPKTCRGFISTIDFMPHILCNISRFQNTSDSGQYKLIHHEYAGLANVENNTGASSDYDISTQITDFLTEEVVSRLAIKKTYDENGKALTASGQIRQKLIFCIAKDESASNPTVIECNNLAIAQADKEIKRIAAIILSNLTGIDAHGRDLSLAKPFFKKEISNFYEYRNNASSIAGLLDGGTGSDIQVASTNLKIDLTLNELKSLEQRNNFIN